MSTRTRTSDGGGIAREGEARAGGGSSREEATVLEGLKDYDPVLGYHDLVMENIRTKQVSENTLMGGLHTYDRGLVKPNAHYPWVFMVSSADGQQVYKVDLIGWECGCRGWQAQGRCRHLVAAARLFIEQEEGKHHV